MSTGISQLAALGAALEYPTAGWRTRLQDLERQLAGHPSAASIQAFLTATEPYSDAGIAEIYTRTFDLAPQCAPYLGVHLFGEQDARRSQLMVGLASEYKATGHDTGSELPDHLSVVLRSLTRLPAQTRDELVRLCVRPALVSMATQLRSSNSPYEHLVRAPIALLDTIRASAVSAEVAHA